MNLQAVLERPRQRLLLQVGELGEELYIADLRQLHLVPYCQNPSVPPAVLELEPQIAVLQELVRISPVMLREHFESVNSELRLEHTSLELLNSESYTGCKPEGLANSRTSLMLSCTGDPPSKKHVDKES